MSGFFVFASGRSSSFCASVGTIVVQPSALAATGFLLGAIVSQPSAFALAAASPPGAIVSQPSASALAMIT